MGLILLLCSQLVLFSLALGKSVAVPLACMAGFVLSWPFEAVTVGCTCLAVDCFARSIGHACPSGSR